MRKILVSAVTLAMLLSLFFFTTQSSFAAANNQPSANSSQITKQLQRVVRKLTRARDIMAKVQSDIPPGVRPDPEQMQLLNTISALAAEIQQTANALMVR